MTPSFPPTRPPVPGPGAGDTWDPPRRWWHGWWGITTLPAVLALVGGGIYAWVQPPDPRCADGVSRMGADHSCVGLTDGSYVFSPDLKGVFDLIHRGARCQRNDLARQPGQSGRSTR